MALENCAECGREISSQAGTCPHCGFKRSSTAAKAGSIIFKVAGYIVGGIVVLMIIGAFVGQSTCKVISVRNGEDAFLVNGELDYGIYSNVVVALDGRGREVTVTVRLETNQGDITRSKRVAVSDNGRREVQVQFIEPTLGTNVRRSVASCK